MTERITAQRDEVELGGCHKRRRTRNGSSIDDGGLDLCMGLNKKYVYLGNDETFRALVFLSNRHKEEWVKASGDLSVDLVNSVGSKVRIPKQYRLINGSAELYIPLVGKHMDGFYLGRWFRIVVTIESSLSWELGLDTKIGTKGAEPAARAIPGGAHVEILQAESETVLVCDGRVLVTKEPEAVYYKDEGGKKNTMEMEVHVVQYQKTRGEIPLPYVPLALKLVYDGANLEEVPDQSILQVISACRMFTGLDGMVKVKFRVSEVTKRHSGKRFRLCMGHYNQQKKDSVIALIPAYSSPFAVLSKRKKKNGGSVKGHIHSDSAESTLTVSDDFQDEISPKSILSTSLQLPLSSTEPSPKPAPLQYSPMLLEHAYSLIYELQWQMVGTWTSTEKNNEIATPLFRCPVCRVSPHPYIPNDFFHDEKCKIGQWLNMYEGFMTTGKGRIPSVSNPHLTPFDGDLHSPNFNMLQKTTRHIEGGEQNGDSN